MMKQLIALFMFATLFSQEPDPSALLAAARQALGGGVLAQITSFTVTGSAWRDYGPFAGREAVEINHILPDKFLRITRRSLDSPFGDSPITQFEGFNGDAPIREIVAPGAGVPAFIPAGPEPKTPEAIAAARQQRLTTRKRRFVEFVLPLFAAVPLVYPLDRAALGTVQLTSGVADVIEFKAADGFAWRLFLDANTHLPVRLAWWDKPIVVASTSSTVLVGPRGQVASSPRGPGLPSGDPTAGLPPVEWQLSFEDYQLTDGANWPRRWKTTVDGRLFEDLRLGNFKINPKIDLKKFQRRDQ